VYVTEYPSSRKAVELSADMSISESQNCTVRSHQCVTITIAWCVALVLLLSRYLSDTSNRFRTVQSIRTATIFNLYSLFF